MVAVQDILARKGCRVLITSATLPLQELARDMAASHMSAAVVVGETGAIAGIVTEHEIALAVSRSDGDTSKMLVGEFMSREVVSCKPTDSDTELLRLMIQGHTSHLPVVSDGRVMGIVSVEDVLANQMESVRNSVDRLLQMTDVTAGRFTVHLRRPQHDGMKHADREPGTPHAEAAGAGRHLHLHRHG